MLSVEVLSTLQTCMLMNSPSYKNENLYDRKIICIVGMPRSGTTLLHQLIAASNDVEGIGESSVIPSFFEDNIFFVNYSWVFNKNTVRILF